METFIVLGFCFILYEALDFFQSCYSNNNRHHQQHPQFNKDISANNTKDTFDENATNLRDVIASASLSEKRVKFSSKLDLASSSHSNHDDDDDDSVVDVDDFDSIRELDSDEPILNNNQSSHNIFSICDRVNNFNRQPLIDYQSENKNSNFNDYDKLIAS